MRPRCYHMFGDGTNTDEETQVTVVSSTTVRPAIYDLLISNATTPADNACNWVLQRITAAGTPGTTFTPVAIDPGDPASAASGGYYQFTVVPTYTANAHLLNISCNQRALARWVSRERGELILPATAANGAALRVKDVTTAAALWKYTIHFSE